MSVDLVLRTLATLTCVYTVGLCITLTSISALSAAGAGAECGPAGCMLAVHEQPTGPPAQSGASKPARLHYA
jgi:hypothetical protein